MDRPTPDLGEVKAPLEQIRNAAYRSRDLIGSIRAMVKRDGRNRTPLDLNDLVRDVLALTERRRSRRRGISIRAAGQHRPIGQTANVDSGCQSFARMRTVSGFYVRVGSSRRQPGDET